MSVGRLEIGPELADTVSISTHGWKTGNAVVYSAGGGVAIGGLIDGATYYVIALDANTLSLATSAYNAAEGKAIDLRSAGGGTAHSLTGVDGNPVTRTYSNSSSQSIPDRATITSRLTIGDNVTISDLNVHINISHVQDADLDVFLISPTGTRVELFTDVGGSGDNFQGTILDDEATASITIGAAPFIGRFRPEGSLSLFDAQNASGVWKLEITDDSKWNVGTLNNWSISVTPAGSYGSRSFDPAAALIANGDAASVFYADQLLPNYFEFQATINAGKPTGGLKSNAYVVFDYQSATDFKFAGVNISTDKIEMGYRDQSGWNVVAQTPAQLVFDKDYKVLVALNGTVATLAVDGSDVLTHVFDARIDVDGYSHGLNAGMVGLGAQSSLSRIDNLRVQVLPPEITLQSTEDFSAGPAALFEGETAGNWQIGGGRDEAAPAAGESVAYSTTSLAIAPAYLASVETRLSTEALGGVIFDQYGPTEYKFAGLLASTGQVVIGHHTARGGLAIDAAVNRSIVAGTDYDLAVTIKGSTVSVLVNNQVVLGHAFNALVVDGDFGLMSYAGKSSFDSVTVSTDDPAYDDGTETTVTIPNDDALPLVTVTATNAVGAEASQDPIVFTVTRAANLVGDIAVNLAWSGAAALGTDYTVSAAGATLSADKLSLTLAAGVTSATLMATPVNDVIAEAAESMTLTVTAGTAYTVGASATASGTITDNDVATLSVGDASITEGNTGTKTVAVTVTLSTPSATPVTVSYATGGGTSTSGTDYLSISGILTFSPGVTTQTIYATINGDRTKENNETFQILLSNASVLFTKQTGTVTITNDD